MVATWKKDTVSRFHKELKAHKVVGIVSIKNMPSKQMQDMKKKLKGHATIYVARSNLIRRTLDKAGIKGMDEHVQGPSGIVFSDLNPFKLEKLIYGCKTKAAARAGSIAPFDLVIPAGDTGLAAGPVIGDLQGAGIKARIQGGKIIVSEDSVLVKAGKPVEPKVAAVLARLGIEPMEIVLKVSAAHEDGTVYPGSILHIDEEETQGRIGDAFRKSLNLSVNAGIFNRAAMPYMINEAICRARNLMINAGIVNKETIGIYLGRADAAANSIKSVLPPELQAELDKKD
jgi:large subunit ribosomal protein L10